MTDGVLDLVVLVIVIGIVIGLGFGLLMPILDSSKIEATEQIYDNSIEKAVGESVNDYGDYDGTVDRLEVILATQVMDFGSPEPRTIQVENERIDITSTYKYDLIEYANRIWNKIKDDPADTKYKYEFDFGNPSSSSDDAYSIIQVPEEVE